MIIDNFKIIEDTIINFDLRDPNDSNPVHKDPYVYQIEIMARKKDNVKTYGANNSARLIATFYPEDKDQWERYKLRIKDICDSMPGARAYINPSAKRASKILKSLNMELAVRISSEAYTGLKRTYDSAVAKTSPDKIDNRWIIDIDSDDPWSVSDIEDYLKNVPFPNKGNKNVIIAIIPSKSGTHIITEPFNISEFNTWLQHTFNTVKHDMVKRNALTNLYINTAE